MLDKIAIKDIRINIFFPRRRGNVINKPPHALLEDVRKIATDKMTIRNIEMLFLKIFRDLSKRNAIENGQRIFSQQPA